MTHPLTWPGIRHLRYVVWRTLYNHWWLRCLPRYSLLIWSWENHLDAIWRGER